ncbi:MAG: hypothetical protein EXQ71_09220 [Acidimicrobiia bacterium]|nr:hypothetical protein [Acidimicrobiia bacterium]
MPALAATSAMPDPMIPDPTIPSLVMLMDADATDRPRVRSKGLARHSVRAMSGTLALVGGDAWRPGCSFDQDLLTASGGTHVLVLATAAAYEHPQRAIQTAEAWFASLGATVGSLPILIRSDALEATHLGHIAEARFIYLADGSPMHLRAVLKNSPVWDAIVTAWREGAVLAGSGSGAMVLCDPLVDPRGGALTLGLGLQERMALIPHHDTWSHEKEKRTLKIAPRGLPIVGIDERTALLRHPDGTWQAAGAGRVTVFVDGLPTDLSVLP